jgi:hypothetical protein
LRGSRIYNRRCASDGLTRERRPSPCKRRGAPRSAASRWEVAANPWLGAIAWCSRTGSSNPSPSRGESVSLQISPPFQGKAPVSASFGDYAGRQGRQRRAKPRNIERRSGSVSVELYSSTAVLLAAVSREWRGWPYVNYWWAPRASRRATTRAQWRRLQTLARELEKGSGSLRVSVSTPLAH